MFLAHFSILKFDIILKVNLNYVLYSGSFTLQAVLKARFEYISQRFHGILNITKVRGTHIFFLLFITLCLSCQRDKQTGKNLPLVYIKESKGKFTLIRNGKPFYIKGGAAEAKYLEELKNAGANTARIYDTTDLKNTLDRAADLGLAVVVDIPLPKHNKSGEFYENRELFNELKSKVEEVVQRHKDHPALLYWNLGNELYYPYFFVSTKFHNRFNQLIDLVHEADPNHPVSTTTIGANKLRVLSITWKSPQLDFISFNSFGILSSFETRLKPITPFWNGPHVITEWGVNGPWEAKMTSWGVPIEETSTKKAEQITERYFNFIKPLEDQNSLGSFVFYWGQKNEVTPTWYSLFDGELKSEGVYSLSQIWKKEQRHFPGPKLEYILLNEKGAEDNVLLAPGEEALATTFLPTIDFSNYIFEWEIREESWYAFHISKPIAPSNFEQEGSTLTFTAPNDPGPYRLHLKITNDTGYYATANIPFYVLDPFNE